MCHGVGGAAVYDMKYTPWYDGGQTHRKIRLDYLAPCSPFDDLVPDGIACARNVVLVSAPSQPKSDNRLPIDKLKDALIIGSRRGKKKGWHRRALGLGTNIRMNKMERQQFLVELLLLEQHLNEATVVDSKKKG